MISKNYSQVIVTGSIGYDIIMNFPSLFVDYLQPDKLHQINISFVVSRLEKQLGGIATNIAYNFSLVSDMPIKILGAVGKDGDQILSFIKKNKINIDGILIDKRLYTSTGTVMTDIKDNQIWGYYYGAGKRGKDIDLKKHIDQSTLMIISANYPSSFLHFQSEAIKQKIDYLYDPGMLITAIKKERLFEGMNHCRWLVGNDYEIGLILKLLKIKPKTLIDKGKVLITTLGEKGVCYLDKESHYHVQAYKVRRVLDPTGAGDAWRGGFVSGIIDRKTVLSCLKQANSLASFAVEKYGTVNHRPTKKEILYRINQLKSVQPICGLI